VIRGAHGGEIDDLKHMFGRLRSLFGKLLTCQLKEESKAFVFLIVRPHGSLMAKSYDFLQILALM
jgi:hypothetical protein